MNSGDGKYKDVIGFLRRSEPVITDQEALTERIIQEIRRKKPSSRLFDLISDYLFSWVYIGWVRRSLIAVSFAILLVFVFQQSVILKRINAIDRQAIFTSNQLIPQVNDKLDTRLLYKRVEYSLPASRKELSDKQIDELIKSFNELQVKYKDILKLIEDDPDLKNYIEKKLKQNEREKLKL
jgi:hypothetical protein